jgi:hypothetical protein
MRVACGRNRACRDSVGCHPVAADPGFGSVLRGNVDLWVVLMACRVRAHAEKGWRRSGDCRDMDAHRGGLGPVRSHMNLAERNSRVYRCVRPHVLQSLVFGVP